MPPSEIGLKEWFRLSANIFVQLLEALPGRRKSRRNRVQGLIPYVDNKARIEEVLESRSAGLNGCYLP